jgi:DUF917 family protein
MDRASHVLLEEKAKVMSYKDIEEARGKRAAKEATIASGKRSRKRKSPTPAKEVKNKKARGSEIEVAEDEIAAAGLGDHCSVLQF